MKNQRSIQRIDDGAEEVGNLNSSVRGEGRILNVLCRWRVKYKIQWIEYTVYYLYKKLYDISSPYQQLHLPTHVAYYH